MMRSLRRPVPASEDQGDTVDKDLLYYLLLGGGWFGVLMIAWALSPWFPWS